MGRGTLEETGLIGELVLCMYAKKESSGVFVILLT